MLDFTRQNNAYNSAFKQFFFHSDILSEDAIEEPFLHAQWNCPQYFHSPVDVEL